MGIGQHAVECRYEVLTMDGWSGDNRASGGGPNTIGKKRIVYVAWDNVPMEMRNTVPKGGKVNFYCIGQCAQDLFNR